MPLELLIATGCWKILAVHGPTLAGALIVLGNQALAALRGFYPSPGKEVRVTVVCCTVIWILGEQILRYLCCAHLLWV